MIIVSTTDCAKGSRRGAGATFRRPGLGHDGKVKMVEIDATMVTPEMINMVLDIVNRWSVSEARHNEKEGEAPGCSRF